MKKWLFIIGAPAIVLAVIGVSVYDQVRYAQKKGYTVNCTHSGEPSTAADSLICVTDRHQEYDDGKPYPPPWNGFFAWPEGVTALLLLFTLGSISWQSWETRQSAKAMRESIRLQQAGMQQWVDVEALGSEVAGKTYGRREPDFVVNLSFEAVNNTANVLTIMGIETIVDMIPGESEVFTLQTNVTLPPREKNRYSFFVPCQTITREWFSKGTIVTINGSVTFRDCLGEDRSDYFGGLYDCGEGRLMKLKMLGIIPDRTIEKSRIPRMMGNDASGKPWTENLTANHFWMRWKWQIWRSPSANDPKDEHKT